MRRRSRPARPRRSTPSDAAACCSPLRRPGAAARRAEPGHVGVPGHRGHVLRRPVRRPTSSTGTLYPEAFAAGEPASSTSWLGRRQHGRPAGQQPDDGPGRPRTRRLGDRKPADAAPARHDGPGRRRSSGSRRIEYYDRVSTSTWSPGSHFDVRPRRSPEADAPAQLPARSQLFFVLYFFMTGLHAFHMIIGIGVDRRASPAGLRAGRFTRRSHRRRGRPGCTGTSSTSSGCSSTRCST